MVVAHVVEMVVELVEAVVVAHKFSMKMLLILMGLSLEQLKLDQQQLFYPFSGFCH